MSSKYNIGLQTTNEDGAGTNAEVHVMLVGDAGASDWLNLENPGDDTERGKYDLYGFRLDHRVSRIHTIKMRVHKTDNDGPNWKLSFVDVDWDGGQWVGDEWVPARYRFQFNNWIRPTPDRQWVYVDGFASA